MTINWDYLFQLAAQIGHFIIYETESPEDDSPKDDDPKDPEDGDDDDDDDDLPGDGLPEVPFDPCPWCPPGVPPIGPYRPGGPKAPPKKSSQTQLNPTGNRQSAGRAQWLLLNGDNYFHSSNTLTNN